MIYLTTEQQERERRLQRAGTWRWGFVVLALAILTVLISADLRGSVLAEQTTGLIIEPSGSVEEGRWCDEAERLPMPIMSLDRDGSAKRSRFDEWGDRQGFARQTGPEEALSMPSSHTGVSWIHAGAILIVLGTIAAFAGFMVLVTLELTD